MWPDMSMVCGIMQPETPLATPKILSTISHSIRFPADKPVTGVGRFLGSDPVECHGLDFVCAGNLDRKHYLDLYLLPDRKSPAVQVLVDGQPVPVRPEPRLWIAGAVVVARIELPKDPPRTIEIRGGGEPVPVATR
jgi:hypothetical protein